MAATAASLIRLCGGGGGGSGGAGGGPSGSGSGGAATIGRSHAPFSRSLRPCTSAKRKSAVELLQETKAFYVKSDSVLDRHQQLPHSDHLQVSPDWTPLCSLKLSGSPPPAVVATGLLLPLPPASTIHPQLSLPLSLPLPLSPPPSPENSDLIVGAEPMPPAPPGFQHSSEPGPVSPRRTPHAVPPPLPPKSPRLSATATSAPSATWAQRRSTSSYHQHSDRLQSKLRRLLGADSKEDILRDRDGTRSGSTVGTPDEPAHRGDLQQDPLRTRLDQEEARIIGGGRSSWRQYRRSNSQTHHGERRQPERRPSKFAQRGDARSSSRSYSLHKSLPDLHSSPAHSVRSARSSAQRRLTASSWSSDSHSHSVSRSSVSSSSSRSGPSADFETALLGCDGVPSHSSSSHRGRLSLGSTPPHYIGDCVSVISSGGRTQRSGHSAPSQAQGSTGVNDVRGTPQGELRRGGSSGSSSGTRTHRSQPEGLFRTSSMTRKSPEMLIRQGSEGSSAEMSGLSWRGGSSRSRQRKKKNHNQYRALRSHSSSVEIDAGSPEHERVISPRQSSVAELCWAFESRRPILRSKSDISHRYTRGVGPAPATAQSPPPRPDPEQLKNFFDHLGLESDEYQYVSGRHSHSSSSPVYFSSVSSIDSATAAWGPHWSSHSVSGAGGTALTVSGQGATAGSGHSGKLPEQPSIVERNARIIKWLCNCRKAQMNLGYGNNTTGS